MFTSSCHTSVISDHATSIDHKLKWDHFEILAKGQSEAHCKVKETSTNLVTEVNLNDEVCSEKLYFYYFASSNVQIFSASAIVIVSHLS